MNLRLSSLPIQLLAFLVLPLFVLLVLVAFGGAALHQVAMRDLLVSHNTQIVLEVAASIDEQLQQRYAALSRLTQSSGQQSPQSTLAISGGWLETFFDGGVALYTPEGNVLAVSSWATDWEALWSQLTKDSPSGNITRAAYLPIVDPDQNKTWVVIGVPGWSQSPEHEVHIDSYVVGVVSLEMPELSNILSGLHTSGNTTVYLSRANGLVLYHSDPIHVGKVLDEIPAPDAGASYRTDHQGRDVISTVALVPNTDWILVQEEQWKVTLDPLMRYSQAAPLVLVPGLLITLGALWFGIQRIVQPLQRLGIQATELAWGDYTAINQNVGGIEEIKRLQTTLRHMSRRVRTTQQGMRNYIAAITHAQEDERTRLAHELHDQTAQSLVALDHRLQMLKPLLRDDPKARDLLSSNRAMIVQILDDLRRIVRAMRPIYLEELGLVPALEMLARDLDHKEDITIHFEKYGTPQRLSDEQEIVLYRVAQEALNNVWQHSDGTCAWLSVEFGETEIIVSVRDNGRGFEAPRYASDLTETGEGQFGIVGMYERASLIGAHLQIKSQPSAGTSVIVRIPVS